MATPPSDPAFANVALGLPVVRAMLLGTGLGLPALLAPTPGHQQRVFRGIGRAYASVISLTIAAQCFGAGLTAIGLTQSLLALVGHNRTLGVLLAIVFPGVLAMLSGSGSGPVLAFAQSLLPQIWTKATSPCASPPSPATGATSGAPSRRFRPWSSTPPAWSESTPRELLRHVWRPLLVGGLVSFVVALTW